MHLLLHKHSFLALRSYVATFGESIKIRSSPGNLSSRPPLKEKSNMRIFFCFSNTKLLQMFCANTSPNVLSRFVGLNATYPSTVSLK